MAEDDYKPTATQTVPQKQRRDPALPEITPNIDYSAPVDVPITETISEAQPRNPTLSEINLAIYEPKAADTRHDAVIAVESFLDHNNIKISADGEFSIPEQGATTYDEIAEVSVLTPPSLREIQDRMILSGCPVKPSLIATGLRQVMRDRARNRKKELVSLLTRRPTQAERELGRAQIHRLVSTAFEGDMMTSAAIILHFIYQVKRKMAKLDVFDHLMPVLVSGQQGVGKTRTVKRFLAPAAELAKPVLLSDIVDPRSIHVFRHLILIADDMEKLHPADVPILKTRVTGEIVNGRGMHSNRDIETAQMATFIGTANQTVTSLIPDDTGHRRFFELVFRNGNPATGGDPEIWAVINQADFTAIWRSVDPFEPSPLEAVRNKVFGPTITPFETSKVHGWAAKLDVGSEEFGSIVTPSGVPARSLYDFYGEDTEDVELSETAFGIAMKKATFDERVPFSYPKRSGSGYFYKLRPIKR